MLLSNGKIKLSVLHGGVRPMLMYWGTPVFFVVESLGQGQSSLLKIMRDPPVAATLDIMARFLMG